MHIREPYTLEVLYVYYIIYYGPKSRLRPWTLPRPKRKTRDACAEGSFTAKDCDIVRITGSSTAFSFMRTQHPNTSGRGPSHGRSPMCATPSKNSAQLLENKSHWTSPQRYATSSSIESSTRVCHRPTSSTI